MDAMHRAIKDRRKGMAVTIIIPTAEEAEMRDNEAIDPDMESEEIGVSPGEIEDIPQDQAGEVSDEQLAALSGDGEYSENMPARTFGEKVKMQAMKLRNKGK